MSGLPSPFDLPQHCGRGVPAPCGCEYEAGTWYICDAHRTPHSQHTTPCPACDACREPPAELIYEDLGDCDDEYLAKLFHSNERIA